jgi:hypothetical protein
MSFYQKKLRNHLHFTILYNFYPNLCEKTKALNA